MITVQTCKLTNLIITNKYRTKELSIILGNKKRVILDHFYKILAMQS